MFYHFFYPISHHISVFNVFRYITLRSFLSFVIASVASIIWGKYFIRYMQKRQFGQVVRDDGPKSHLKKAGTPTFGGIFVIGSILISILFCGNFTSLPLFLTILVMMSYFFLGLMDDYLKVLKKNSKGVSAKGKLLWQFITAGIVSWILVQSRVIDTSLYVPFLKGPLIDLGPYFYILFSSIVIVGFSNAVNLTDGLDGLAIGPIMVSAATMGTLAYLAGHKEMSLYLYIPYLEHGGELVVLLASLVGAGMGFLWYNAYPAQIFLGDVGALSLGGVLGVVSVLTKNEILFVLIGGIFVIEAVSVILQVFFFKWKKKRVFKMAPIHHHFELSGLTEPKVIVRFWIISVILSILALSTIKLR